ncbi:MAG TPA: hypothetical protein VFL97_07410 [Nitrococcus sp.]|nr:hypothetical protein [Nitrococcus sp.]
MAFGAAALLLAGSALAATEHTGSTTNYYGGPAYTGKPDLKATAALVKAGGGAEHFSFEKALVSMLGEKTVHAEVAKLTKQYGEKNVHDWVNGFNFAVDDALKHATAEGIKLPPAPENLHGKKLAATLVSAGTTPDDVFWSGLLYDHTLSHKIHDQVMNDIDAKYGEPYDKNLHAITNQAMYDVAHALGKKHVKLASLH